MVAGLFFWKDAEDFGGRRAIGFIAFLSPRDDDVACIAANVDHIAEIAVGVVIVVALLFL